MVVDIEELKNSIHDCRSEPRTWEALEQYHKLTFSYPEGTLRR